MAAAPSSGRNGVNCSATISAAMPTLAGKSAAYGKEYVYLDQLVWFGTATLPGSSSTAIPTGYAPDRLPVDVQIVGPRLEDPMMSLVIVFPSHQTSLAERSRRTLARSVRAASAAPDERQVCQI
jgi:hypothetical protein